ncbi:MAG TPA: hypothetical protein VHV08_17915 [Pirellulales bacterium]|jgi:hypothetical protein|nr:hypothetical protein [Pirellulales bacterium]
MSHRERWTVYPLLFLTLGIALKDKITKEITADKVSCKALLVTDRAGKPELAMATTQSGGFMRIQGKEGLGIALGYADRLFGLMFTDAAGNILRPSIGIPLTPRRPDGQPEPVTPHEPPGESAQPPGGTDAEPPLNQSE